MLIDLLERNSVSIFANEDEYKNYIYEKIIEQYSGLINKNVHSIIIDRNLKIVFASHCSAQSVGFECGDELVGVCFYDYDNPAILKKLFGEAYNEINHEIIVNYGKTLLELQQKVFNECLVVKFIDMMPYNNQFISYITTYFPIVHSSGEVVAILSTSIKSYILRFQGHWERSDYISEYNEKFMDIKDKFSERELEILFLLSNGATQEQIAQILGVTRGTIATAVSNQLCPKFNIAGSNTKLLIRKAIQAGLYRKMPISLWHPCLIILNEDLTRY